MAAHAKLRDTILAWYDANRRDLPWRAAPGARPDPYAVFVSEAMLQQTRVETVLRRYAAWMERFPDWHSLAEASQADVMAAWAGLGYYRRARDLHAAARMVADRGLPHHVDALRALPGVGPYTAGAVASIVHGQAVPAVDGNAIRVLSRIFDIQEPVDAPAGRRAVAGLAAELVPPEAPGDWNQALMDLGATVCTPRPRCDACPVTCAARAAGTATLRPVKSPRRPPRAQDVHLLMFVHGGRVAVELLAEGLLAGTWMLPRAPGPQGLPAPPDTRGTHGAPAPPGTPATAGTRGRPTRRDPPLAIATASHRFTHRIWHMRIDVHHEQAPGLRWVDPDRPDVALSTACRKGIAAGLSALAALGAAAGGRSFDPRDRQTL